MTLPTQLEFLEENGSGGHLAVLLTLLSGITAAAFTLGCQYRRQKNRIKAKLSKLGTDSHALAGRDLVTLLHEMASKMQPETLNRVITSHDVMDKHGDPLVVEVLRLLASFRFSVFGGGQLPRLAAELIRHRLADLTLNSRAVLVCALHEVGGADMPPAYAEAIAGIFCGTHGRDLVELKKAVNVGVLGSDLHSLLCRDFSRDHLRFATLQHFALERQQLQSQADVGTPRALTSSSQYHSPAGYQVVTDVDDTLIAGYNDARFPAGTVYPGARTFIRELMRSGASAAASGREHSSGRRPSIASTASAFSVSTDAARDPQGGSSARSADAANFITPGWYDKFSGRGLTAAASMVGNLAPVAETDAEPDQEAAEAPDASSDIDDSASESDGGRSDADGGVPAVPTSESVERAVQHVRATIEEKQPHRSTPHDNEEEESDADGSPNTATQRHNAAQNGHILVLTARPNGLMKMSTAKLLLQHGFPHPVILAGRVADFRSNVTIAWRKHDNWMEYSCVFPEARFVFVGDSGQGDALTASMARQHMAPGRLVAAFIHDINAQSAGSTEQPQSPAKMQQQGVVAASAVDLNSASSGAGAMPAQTAPESSPIVPQANAQSSDATGDGGSKTAYSNEGICFFATYIAAARMAHGKGLISLDAVIRVTTSVVDEALAIDFEEVSRRKRWLGRERGVPRSAVQMPADHSLTMQAQNQARASSSNNAMSSEQLRRAALQRSLADLDALARYLVQQQSGGSSSRTSVSSPGRSSPASRREHVELLRKRLSAALARQSS